MAGAGAGFSLESAESVDSTSSKAFSRVVCFFFFFVFLSGSSSPLEFQIQSRGGCLVHLLSCSDLRARAQDFAGDNGIVVLIAAGEHVRSLRSVSAVDASRAANPALAAESEYIVVPAPGMRARVSDDAQHSIRVDFSVPRGDQLRFVLPPHVTSQPQQRREPPPLSPPQDQTAGEEPPQRQQPRAKRSRAGVAAARLGDADGWGTGTAREWSSGSYEAVTALEARHASRAGIESRTMRIAAMM